MRARGLGQPCAWLVASIVACSSASGGDASSTGDSEADDGTAAPEVGVDGDVDTAEVAAPVCGEGPRFAWSAGPHGTRRGDLAGDFEVPLTDGSAWSYAGTFTGCDTIVVIPDRLVVSPLQPVSIWDDDAGLRDLLARSPAEVIYLFVSSASDEAAADAHALAMRARLDALLEDPGLAAWWRPRLLVSDTRAQALDGWVGPALTGHLAMGIAIAPDQRIHGVGSLADVRRRDERLAAAGEWPWKSNVAYAAYDARYAQAEAARQAALDAEDTTVVNLWDADLLAERAEVDVTLPTAEVMAGFDTLEVELIARCPDPDVPEVGNCGAWDYLASLSVRDGERDLEVVRAITTYHRESRWVVDATALLPALASGGPRRFSWSFAPSWNTQPTVWSVRLRLSDRGRGVRPARVTPLFTGGAFGAAYNAAREPAIVPIGAGARRVELWAIITGHGAGTAQCAEFCAHAHTFTIDGHANVRTFDEARAEEGCVAELARGMTPNQAGTWWFGRGGWCPGQAVAPWIVDVTAEVTPGADATVTYRGTLAGAEPPDGAGDIVLTSYLVEYE
ncbi:MAG: hypothetical protein IT385_20290 [Deltaproteobacteria bacterium]|nr:hypothetical protein [Deltaproteobacteria bacterium]